MIQCSWAFMREHVTIQVMSSLDTPLFDMSPENLIKYMLYSGLYSEKTINKWKKRAGKQLVAEDSQKEVPSITEIEKQVDSALCSNDPQSSTSKQNNSQILNEIIQSIFSQSNNDQTLKQSCSSNLNDTDSLIKVPVKNTCIDISSDESSLNETGLNRNSPTRSRNDNRNIDNIDIFETKDHKLRYRDQDNDKVLGTNELHSSKSGTIIIDLPIFIFVRSALK